MCWFDGICFESCPVQYLKWLEEIFFLFLYPVLTSSVRTSESATQTMCGMLPAVDFTQSGCISGSLRQAKGCL